MTSEAENKLLARRFLEEVGNTGMVDHLEALLELGVVRWASDVGATNRTAQPGTEPHDIPAKPVDKSRATEGPPSMG